MIKHIRYSVLLLCLFFISCREQSNISGYSAADSFITGKIENWKPNHGNSLYFLNIVNFNGLSSLTFFHHAKTPIEENGTFTFPELPNPVDSILRWTHMSAINHDSLNYGLLTDSIHPYLQNYASNYFTIPGRFYWNDIYVYGGNSDRSYFAFFDPKNPIGTYSVILEYVAKNYSTKYTVTEPSGLRRVTWRYDLNLRKGWNIVYIRQSAKTDSTMQIDINQIPPEEPIKWFIEYYMTPVYINQNPLTGRLYKYR